MYSGNRVSLCQRVRRTVRKFYQTCSCNAWSCHVWTGWFCSAHIVFSFFDSTEAAIPRFLYRSESEGKDFPLASSGPLSGSARQGERMLVTRQTDLIFRGGIVSKATVGQLVDELVSRFKVTCASRVLSRMGALKFQRTATASVSLKVSSLLAVPSGK